MSPTDRLVCIAHALGRFEELIAAGKYAEAVALSRRVRAEVVADMPPELAAVARRLTEVAS